AATRAVRPEEHPHSEGDGEQQAERHPQRRRRLLLGDDVRARLRGGRSLGWQERLVRDRLELLVDLLELFVPVSHESGRELGDGRRECARRRRAPWWDERRAAGDGRWTRTCRRAPRAGTPRSEEHTSELQSRENLVCRLLLE